MGVNGALPLCKGQSVSHQPTVMFGVLLLLAAGVTAFVPSAPRPLLTKPAAVRAASMEAEGRFPAAAASDIKSLSKKQLVQLAKKAGLKVTGNKREITLRITKRGRSRSRESPRR